VFEMRAHMTHVEHRSDFSDQILADQEAMSRMQDEGGGSEASDANTSVSAAKGAQGHNRDSSPIIALYRDPASAEAALSQLRSMGIVNENIGAACSDSVILSFEEPAPNSAGHDADFEANQYRHPLH
jgi:hypothetical protein